MCISLIETICLLTYPQALQLRHRLVWELKSALRPVVYAWGGSGAGRLGLETEAEEKLEMLRTWEAKQARKRVVYGLRYDRPGESTREDLNEWAEAAPWGPQPLSAVQTARNLPSLASGPKLSGLRRHGVARPTAGRRARRKAITWPRRRSRSIRTAWALGANPERFGAKVTNGSTASRSSTKKARSGSRESHVYVARGTWR